MALRIKTVFVLLCISIIAFSQYELSRWCERSRSICEEYKDYPDKIADAARSLEDENVVYDPSYVRIKFPMGDVSSDRGVCTDVVIRAFRKGLNRDLQEEVYAYRKEVCKNEKIDTNIDHRRVKNLVRYFDALFEILELETHHKEFKKGNIVVWDLGGGQWHIGICVAKDTIIHNICCGQVIEPMYMQDRVIRNYSFDVSKHRKIAESCKEDGEL